MSCKRSMNHRGFTLVEAAVSSIVVALMLAASLNAAGAARARNKQNEDRATGVWLAQTLLREITAQPYAERGVALFGIELGEDPGRRNTLDDVDDYDGLIEKPVCDAGGTALPGYEQWKRSVTVCYVLASNLLTESVTDTGLKRIIVKAWRGNAPPVQLSGIRSLARDSW